MEPLFINQDWTSFKLHGPCAGISLPSKEAARNSLWMPNDVMTGAREYTSYECHDLRVVKVDASGQASLLFVSELNRHCLLTVAKLPR